MDAGFLGEHLLQTLSHAWQFLLHPPFEFADAESRVNNCHKLGVVIPHSGNFYFCAVQSKTLVKKYVHPLSWDSKADECSNALANISLVEDAKSYQKLQLQNIKLFSPLNEPYDSERLVLLKDCAFLTEPEVLFYINFNDPHQIESFLTSETEHCVEIVSNKEGYFHAIAAWFSVNLDENITLSSSPLNDNAENCNWDQAIYPCDSVHYLYPGSRIIISACWKDGKILMNVNKIIHSNNEVAYDVVSASNGNIPTCTKLIGMMNDAKLLESLNDAAIKFMESSLNDRKELHILDLFPIPVFGLTVLKNLQKSNYFVHLYCYSESDGTKQAIETIVKMNSIAVENVSFLSYSELWETGSDVYKETFDIIIVDLIEQTGNLDTHYDEKMCSCNMMRKQNGIILPQQIRICSDLIYSDDIERNMGIVDDEIMKFGIGKLINAYQVSQILEMNLPDLKCVKCSDMFFNLFLSPETLNVSRKEFFVKVNQSASSIINCVPYWYEIAFENGQKHYSTYDRFSYVQQAAFLLKTPLMVHGDNVIVQFVYENGDFLINVKNSNRSEE